MPFLSRIWINPLRRGAQKLLGNPQAMRAAVMGGIPEQPARERVLWRLDADEPRRPGLLVVTRSHPSWEHLVEQAGWPSADGPQAKVRDYEPLLDRLESGQQFAFRLTANPVQSTKSPQKLTPRQASGRERDPRKSIRVGHRTVAHQLRWLLDRVPSWGVRIPESRVDAAALEGHDGDSIVPPLDIQISGRQRRSFRRNDGVTVTLQQVTYEGHLVVEDPGRFRELLIGGVGPAKAYGCGLMTLASSSGQG